MKARELIIDAIAVIIGSFIYSIAINTFTLPNLIVPGGIIGISTVIHYYSGFPVGTMSLILDIPLFIAAFRFIGTKSTLKILITSFIFFLMPDITGLFLPQYTEDILVAAIFGGVLGGLGLGIMILRGISTGGTDLLAQIINTRVKSISYGMMLTLIDAVVVIIAAIAFKDINSMLYAAITIYITGIVLDRIANGFDSAKLVQVITEDPTELSQQIMTQMDRGVTLLKSKGAYTGTDREMVFIVVKRYELQRLKTLIRRTDPKAFIIIGEVSEVLGEGFKTEEN